MQTGPNETLSFGLPCMFTDLVLLSTLLFRGAGLSPSCALSCCGLCLQGRCLILRNPLRFSLTISLFSENRFLSRYILSRETTSSLLANWK